MNPISLPFLIICLLLAAPATSNADSPYVVTASFANDSLSKGVSETNGKSQGMLEASAKRSKWSASARLSDIYTSAGSDYQWQVGGGYATKWKDLDLSAKAFYKSREGGQPGFQKDNVELTTEVTKPIRRYTSVKWQMVYSPDNAGSTRSALWNEVSLIHKRNDRLTLSLNVGKRQVKPARDYVAWSAAAKLKIAPRLTVDIKWHDTDKHSYGKIYKSGLVVGLTRRFG